MERFWFVLVIIIAYFLGNISPSILLGRAKGVDIKKEAGSRAAEIDVGMGRNRLVGPASASDELNQMPLCLQVGYQQRVCCCSDRLLAFGLAGGYVLCPGSIYRSYLASAL